MDLIWSLAVPRIGISGRRLSAPTPSTGGHGQLFQAGGGRRRPSRRSLLDVGDKQGRFLPHMRGGRMENRLRQTLGVVSLAAALVSAPQVCKAKGG